MIHSWPWAGDLLQLVDVRSSEQQLAQYLAVRAGVRRALDDWIPGARFDAYCLVLAKLGLFVEVDCLFKPIAEAVHIAGAEIVPTTRAFGFPFRVGDEAPSGSVVHVVVSSRADWAAEAHASSWYSVVIGSRCIRKPLVEHLRLGSAFGYPECCVRFFLQHNDWPRMNTVADSAAASARFLWETNCFPRHTPWMTHFHLPCSFSCPRTRDYSTAVLAEVRAVDAGYAARIEQFMRLPYLVVNEVLCYALVGGRASGKGRATYEHAIYVGGQARNDLYRECLALGDELEVADGSVFVMRRGRCVQTLEARCDSGRIDIPVLLRFE